LSESVKVADDLPTIAPSGFVQVKLVRVLATRVTGRGSW
jgi:hypothetical protein